MTTQESRLPDGWMVDGSDLGDYEVGVDRAVFHAGKSSGSIKAAVPSPKGFCTLAQVFKADSHRGQRLRMSGYIKAEGVTGWTSLWMRVDGPNRQPLGFDNMRARPIQGTSDWASYQIVLDVPAESTAIAFGFLLSGGGQAWADDFAFEVVGHQVPTTGDVAPEGYPDAPRNLDFES
jgi:hypothetical protein